MATCWFCGVDASNAKDNLRETVNADVEFKYEFPNKRITTWKESTVSIPRCGACRRAHSRERALLYTGTAIGIVIGVIAWWKLILAKYTLLAFFDIGMFTYAGFGIGRAVGLAICPAGVRSQETKFQHPAIAEVLRVRWSPEPYPTNWTYWHPTPLIRHPYATAIIAIFLAVVAVLPLAAATKVDHPKQQADHEGPSTNGAAAPNTATSWTIGDLGNTKSGPWLLDYRRVQRSGGITSDNRSYAQGAGRGSRSP